MPTAAKVVPIKTVYPKSQSEEPKRKYWLYDPKTKAAIPHRYYVHLRNAHDAALLEMRWKRDVGQVIEVINAVKGKLLGQYWRTRNTLEFKVWEES